MSTTTQRHPIIWTLLIVPFGAIGGFVGVVLAHLATKRDLTVEEGATLVAVGMLPHTWKFLFAPVVDLTLSRKIWYGISAAICALGVLGMAAVPLGPDTLATHRAIIFVSSTASALLGMAVEGWMAHLTPEDQRGRAGGWFQAGNLGGSGIGGGLGLYLATHLPDPWMSGAVLGLAFAFCGALMFTLPDVPREQGKGVVAAVRGVVMELWEVIRTRDGLLAALICFLPIGTGAAGGVLAQAEIAAKWGADESHVGLVSGVLSGVIAALGCLVGGELCRFMSTRTAYASIGVLMALIAAIMGLAPANPTTFVVGGLIYSFATGLAYAAFTGLVLDTIGKGAVATKYNIFASLSNTPITYMGLVLASAATAWGPAGMLYTEAGAGLVAIALFYAVVMAVGARKATA